MIRLGPDHGPVVVVVLPLFEEANRTRTFAVTMMRALAVRGVASALPDLPGTGDSLVATEAATLADWQSALSAAAASVGARASVAIRSGALLDGAIANRWHLAPQNGAALVRELDRLRAADGRIAGNRVDPGVIDALSLAAPAAARTVRLESDPGPADRTVPGAPLWRRAEPGNDPVLAEALADDIADWVRQCAD
ncbi:MAG: hypothetical protein FJ335_08485 [Sphingomonadales bacterium]|nr:hypothetical protein [Sphingomonadales bacterium]